MRGLQVVVDDADAARSHLAAQGIEATDVQEFRGAGSCSSQTPTATAGGSSRSWHRRPLTESGR